MSGLWDASGFVTAGTGWAPWLRVTNLASHAVIAAANLVIVVSLLRFHARRKADLLFPESVRYLTVILLFCVLTHANDVLAFSWPNQVLFTGVEVAAALGAGFAAFRLPHFVRALTRELKSVERVDELTRALRTEARVRDAAERALAERYELLRVRLIALEDLFARSTWIQQSHAAMKHLNEMLADVETVLNERPPGPLRGGMV